MRRSQPRDPRIPFFSGLFLTLVCGAIVLWFGLQNPKFAEQLFNTMLGLFAFGAGALMTLIGWRDR
jgi:hypothetical protein